MAFRETPLYRKPLFWMYMFSFCVLFSFLFFIVQSDIDFANYKRAEQAKLKVAMESVYGDEIKVLSDGREVSIYSNWPTSGATFVEDVEKRTELTVGGMLYESYQFSLHDDATGEIMTVKIYLNKAR